MKKVPVEEVEEEIRRIKPQGKAEDALSPTMQVWCKQILGHSLENMVVCVNWTTEEQLLPNNREFKDTSRNKVATFPLSLLLWQWLLAIRAR